MKKNDELQVNIEGYSADGYGVAKPDGFVLFIPGTVVGERVLVHVTKVNKSYGYAFVKELITPSPHRIEPRCPVFKKCGGCATWHVTYDEEKRFKYAKVLSNLKKAGVDFTPAPVLPSPKLTGYRNKAQYPVREQNGEVCIGFYRGNSHTVIESPCAIQPDIFDSIANAVKVFMTEFGITAYNENTLSGTVRHIYLRRGESIMLCLVVNGDFKHKNELVRKLTVQFSEISTICINYNNKNTNVILGDKYETLYGDGFVTDTLLGKRFRISPAAFYQVNREGCERLYSEVSRIAQIRERDRVLDLYCGIGTIGLCTADKCRELVGVEIVESAVVDARENARLNGVTNAKFFAGDASDIDAIAKGDFDVIIVDPPRKGCDRRTLDFIIDKQPDRLVYVSCDSATLARDLKILVENGFEIKNVTPVDMFPRTKHVECCVLLGRERVIHKMKLWAEPFEKIKSGQKTIELRLYDEKRQRIKSGDKIVFTNITTGETLAAVVMDLHRFDTFDELYKSLPLLKCGYTSENIDKATPADMEQYYSADKQKKYGVVGIVIEKE